MRLVPSMRWNSSCVTFVSSGLLLALQFSTSLAEDRPSRLVFRQATVPQPTWQSSQARPMTTPQPAEPALQQAPPPTPLSEPHTSEREMTRSAVVSSPSASSARFVVPPLATALGQSTSNAGYATRAVLAQSPQRPPIQSNPQRSFHRQIKPFESVQPEPTVSPYLNLYREENDDQSAPTYFAFVRPQLDQLEANRMQQRELQQLRGQVQRMSSAGGQPYQSRMPGTPARYMDTAQFYSNWQY